MRLRETGKSVCMGASRCTQAAKAMGSKKGDLKFSPLQKK